MPKVLYASSQNSDVKYATSIHVADVFFLFEIENKKYAFVDQREFGIFEEQNKDKTLTPILIDNVLDAKNLALKICKEHNLRELEVPTHFPLDIADFLRSKEIELIVKNPFYPERAIKNADEISKIKDAIDRTKYAFRRIEEILREAKIKNDAVVFNGQILTSDFLKHEADRVLLQVDMMSASGLIISCGAQTAIPHHEGHGPIKPHQPIICDIFPMHRATGYYADMTRTYVKGTPSGKMLKIYETVKKSQEASIAAVRPGIACKEIHQICAEKLPELIHGTGHGVGLDIHEPPFLNARSEEVLEVGNVITIEPGLYDADRGSTRLEDIVVVTPDGCRNLTNYTKELLIH